MGKPNEKLRDVDRAMIHSVMFSMGILPMERTDHDMRRALQQLTPEEARVLKRKFRKLWRKAMRAEIGNGRTRASKEQATRAKLGVGKHVPSRAERNARKKLVFDELWDKVIGPIVRGFEDAGGKPMPKVRKA